jgi:hypothetical protein
MSMRNVDHTHPYTDESFGGMFRRGQLVAADGGAPDPTTTDETMEDVAHEAPTEGANRSFERGMEGRSETV